jgi:hypothetical protein
MKFIITTLVLKLMYFYQLTMYYRLFIIVTSGTLAGAWGNARAFYLVDLEKFELRIISAYNFSKLQLLWYN